MLAQERQQKIMEQIQEKGAVTATSLMETFHVSLETIRRDLLQMEKDGSLRRVHGGAVLPGEVKPFRMRSERESIHALQKRSMAEKAMEAVAEGDVIGIDAGSSSALYFARALKDHFRLLTIITCSLEIFDILHGFASFRVILCGGFYHEKEHYFYGSPTTEMLSRLFMRKAFIFPAAVSLEYGLHDHQEEMFSPQKQMMASSNEVYILADSSKFESKALFKVSDMLHSYHYITDYELSDNLLQLYLQNGFHIVRGSRPADI